MRDLVAGKVDAAVLYGPALAHLQRTFDQFAEIRSVPMAPMPVPPSPLGVAVLGQDAFLRSAIDSAIASLTDQGRLDEILREHGLPISPNAP